MNEKEVELNAITSINKLINDPKCTRISGDLSNVCFTGEKTYSVLHPFGVNARIQWSIRSGNGVSIIGSTTSDTVQVNFTTEFNYGELQVVVENCISILQLTACGEILCPVNIAPSRPGPITFDIFLGSRPTVGNFCTNTVANVLWVENVDCAVDYI